MSSIFNRPASPPPRALSPPPHFFRPLPSPSSRAHRKPSSSSSAPSLPPGLQHDKTLLTVRSCEHLPSRRNDLVAHKQPKRTRSALGHNALSNSLPEPFSPPAVAQPHQRTVSLTSRTSPPPSPQLHTPPPPVPPIPSFILSSGDKKLTRRQSPSKVTPIYLPDLDPSSPISDNSPSVVKSKRLASSSKTRQAGITCLKFFSLRNSVKST